ncbi:MAG: outer membrane beta-barrel protein, partial [Prevotella sp.]|nr:outer membrane beta-barrel protein [Prevotella sp.]
ELNKYLGIDDENKKEYTMDVVLKREYSIGGSANVEAGGGPSDGGDWRYKLKGFGLRFSDRTRAVAFGGLNNINESMHYSDWRGEYNDRTSQTGDNHFKQVGGQFVYQAPEDKLTNSTEVNATWSNDFTERRSQSETFMNEISTFGKSEGAGRSKPSSFSLENSFRSTGKFRFSTTFSLNYQRGSSESEGWSLSTSDALFQDSINSSWSRSRGKSENFRGNADGDLTYRLPSGDYISFDFDGSFTRYKTPEVLSLNHYVYHQLGTQDIRDRRTNSPSHQYRYRGGLSYQYKPTKKIHITPSIYIEKSTSQSDNHEYLRDSIDYIFDAQNSYEQRKQTLSWQPGIGFYCYKDWTEWYFNFNAGLRFRFLREQMDYTSEPLTTSLTRHYTQFVPSVYAYLQSDDGKHNISAQYYTWSSTPSVTHLIDRPITSDPLNIFLGNPDLKQSHQHSWNTEYTLRNDSISQTIRFSLNGSLTQNTESYGYTYDPTTGVRTYRPENISGGNWNVSSSVNWSRALDKKKTWFIGNDLSYRYTKSTSHTNTTNSGEAELSRVGTSLVSYSPNVRFQKSKLSLSAVGNVTYRHIHRNITFGEQPTDVWDFSYGMNGTYKLPWNFTFETDLSMHSRRGYTDEEMNDNRLYWDATLTKSIKQGRWVFKLRGYDLLRQVSNVQYYISSQGRTEWWTNSMRRYALLTVSYRFSQKPKKEKEE